jgi:hypothetical protein
MSPETTNQKDRKAPLTTSAHHFVCASSRTRNDYRESLRSTIGISAGQTAIEYEYRFAEDEYEHEHDEIRWDARTLSITAKLTYCEMMQAMNNRLAALLALMRELRSWLFILVGFAAVGWMLLWAAGVFHPKVHSSAEHAPVAIPQGAVLESLKPVAIPRYETAVGTIQAVHRSAIPVTLDPIFSGLGWSLIFGLIASTIFTLFVIPVTYWLFYAGRTDSLRA